MSKNSLIPQETIVSKIIMIRGKKVMLDRDLSTLYGVTTGNLNKAVKRNIDRFPEDFMFQLSKDELDRLIFQSGRSNQRGGIRKRPHVFTEQGIAMLSSVLNSKQAIDVNIQIIRTFTKLREMLSNYEDLKQKIEHIEKTYDKQFRVVFEAIRHMIEQPKKSDQEIGFKPNKKAK
ncbi:ORF6N domain-containing protein [Candidatus Margulisiibacteriota bacterium]